MKKLHRKINYNSVLLQKPTSQCTYLLSVYTQNRLFCEAWHRVQYILQQRGFAGFFRVRYTTSKPHMLSK